MNELRLQATGREGYVFNSTLNYSRSYIRAVQNQTPIFQTLYVHHDSKQVISKIVREMLERIQAIKDNC